MATDSDETSPRERSDDPTSQTPDPEQAAAPDDVIREPEDVAPDTTDGETGEARRVGPEGETEPMSGGSDRPSTGPWPSEAAARATPPPVPASEAPSRTRIVCS